LGFEELLEGEILFRFWQRRTCTTCGDEERAQIGGETSNTPAEAIRQGTLTDYERKRLRKAPLEDLCVDLPHTEWSIPLLCRLGLHCDHPPLLTDWRCGLYVCMGCNNIMPGRPQAAGEPLGAALRRRLLGHLLHLR